MNLWKDGIKKTISPDSIAMKKIENVMKRQIPVVALTAAVTDTEKSKAEKAGMVGFIAKPFKENDILEIIDKFVKKS